MVSGGSREESLLLSRGIKNARTADERHMPIFMPFMDAHTCMVLSEHLKREGAQNFLLYGGWDDSERMMAGFFPYDMMSDITSDKSSCFPIRWLLIKGHGYASLNHRDFLGGLLSAGIKREVLGDIITSFSFLKSDGGYPDENAAYAAVFDLNGMASYISENIVRIGNSGVSITLCEEGFVPDVKRSFDKLSVPVSSLRLDCVVSELTGMSRSDSKDAVLKGCVYVDHTASERPDRLLTENSVISVRGFGKYKFVSVTGQTRSGRMRTEFLKYK